MKDFHIETLEKTASALEKYLPVMEYELYKDYLLVYEHLKAKNDREKQQYQKRADYHRETSKKWRQDNKERHNAYQKQYNEKKRAEKINKSRKADKK